MPPSAISGTPYFRAMREHSRIAVIWGTPTPATIRVVQIEPGPMPTLMPSAPALISASAASAVAILPAIISTPGKVDLARMMASITPWEWPWAVSITITSTPALRSASIRASISSVGPTAAPTRKRPKPSLQALGYFLTFSISLIVIKPLRKRSLSTTSNFSTLVCLRCSFACSRVVPTETVTRLRFVILEEIGKS